MEIKSLSDNVVILQPLSLYFLIVSNFFGPASSPTQTKAVFLVMDVSTSAPSVFNFMAISLRSIVKTPVITTFLS